MRNMKKLLVISVLSTIAILLPASVLSGQRVHYKTIPVEVLKDKIAGAWIGQMIGNIYGLPHENKYISEPGPEKWPYGYTRNLDKLKKYDGAFSDDDTDVEYMYLLVMEKYGPEPTYANLRDAWLYHIRDRVWLANRGALGLMHFGYTPPFTGKSSLNPHWYQIDPQLINEIWSYTAPGMVRYAADKSDWAARITSDDWGVEPTIMYGAMFSAAFFERDIRKIINIGLSELPSGCRYQTTVRDMIALHDKYPADWKKARQEMAQKYYINEPDMTKTIWNANLNGACGILALLYGNGDFQRTLDLSCAMGFDADNQAATIAGLLGVVYGFSSLPKDLYTPVNGWTKPFNDRYINITRYDLPDGSISDMINRTTEMAVQLVKENGGSVSGKPGQEILRINTGAVFHAPVEFCIGPMPLLEINKPVDYSFSTQGNAGYNWTIIKGTLPEGIKFDKGHISGTPSKTGSYTISVQLDDGKKSVTRDFTLLVRDVNIAPEADSVIANVRQVNFNVLDSCWYTFGKSMYAADVDVIRDGVINGPGSVFYSIAAKSKMPKVDYYGYHWKEPRTIDMVALHTGGMEEFGGWFTSLNVQYLDGSGLWVPVEQTMINPPLPGNDVVFYQPHFVEYVITFKPVTTNAIRIIGDAAVQTHWNKYTKQVSGFTSVTELSVYKSSNEKGK
jgi:hypothetical protein